MPYTVALSDSRHQDGTRSINESCGHLHRTEDAAEACRQKLLNWSRDGKECSAHWYNSLILEVYRNGQHILPPPEPGYCIECGKSMPGTGAQCCPACVPEW
jgi:hypothetical protein